MHRQRDGNSGKNRAGQNEKTDRSGPAVSLSLSSGSPLYKHCGFSVMGYQVVESQITTERALLDKCQSHLKTQI